MHPVFYFPHLLSHRIQPEQIDMIVVVFVVFVVFVVVVVVVVVVIMKIFERKLLTVSLSKSIVSMAGVSSV